MGLIYKRLRRAIGEVLLVFTSVIAGYALTVSPQQFPPLSMLLLVVGMFVGALLVSWDD